VQDDHVCADRVAKQLVLLRRLVAAKQQQLREIRTRQLALFAPVVPLVSPLQPIDSASLEPRPAAPLPLSTNEEEAEEGGVKIEPEASIAAIDVDECDDSCVVKLDAEEAAAKQRELVVEQSLREQGYEDDAVAAQQDHEQRRSKRLKMHNKRESQLKCAANGDLFMCPTCYYPSYYPRDERACNKLHCGNRTCGISFCIMCGKPASASCKCIAAAWAR
jgi:hypothetical protein